LTEHTKLKATELPIDPEEEPSGEEEDAPPSDDPDVSQQQEAKGVYDDMSGFVRASRIEAPGIIIDEFTGKTWPVPTGGLLDDIKPHHSPYDIKKDPRFSYQAVCVKGPGGDESGDYESRGWVKVTRRELGFPDNVRLPSEPQSPLDTYYLINGEQVMMKIPVQYADARYASQKKMCDLAVEATAKEVLELPDAVVKNEGRAKFNRDPLAETESDRRVFNKNGFREI